MATFTAVLTILGPVILALLKAWRDGQPARTQENIDAASQQLKTDCMGNADAVERHLDGVLADQAGTGNSNAGSTGGTIGYGSTRTIQGLADFGIRNG